MTETTFAATIEWFGPYPSLTNVHWVARDDWEHGLYMATGERDEIRFIGWTPDGMGRVFDTTHPEHNTILAREGNQRFYIGYVRPLTGSKVLRDNIEANAALTLIRALKPELNDRSYDPKPPAGNNCCMSVFSCFYGTESRDGTYPAVDPPPGFPVIVAYNPHAQERGGCWIRVYTPTPQELQHQEAEISIDTAAVVLVDDFL